MARKSVCVVKRTDWQLGESVLHQLKTYNLLDNREYDKLQQYGLNGTFKTAFWEILYHRRTFSCTTYMQIIQIIVLFNQSVALILQKGGVIQCILSRCTCRKLSRNRA